MHFGQVDVSNYFFHDLLLIEFTFMPVCDEGLTPNNERETKIILNGFSQDMYAHMYKNCIAAVAVVV